MLIPKHDAGDNCIPWSIFEEREPVHNRLIAEPFLHLLVPEVQIDHVSERGQQMVLLRHELIERHCKVGLLHERLDHPEAIGVGKALELQEVADALSVLLVESHGQDVAAVTFRR